MASELRLERRPPLDECARRLASESSHDLEIELAPPRTVVNLRGAPANRSLVTDIQRTLGVELPLMPNRWLGDERLAALWLAPDEWLLVAADGKAAELEAAVREARPVDPWLSVVDVSHNYSCISLSGRRGRELLAMGCALDLREDVISPGDCMQTIFAKSRMLLRVLDQHSYEMWVRNSFARYLAAWLLDARAGIPERASSW